MAPVTPLRTKAGRKFALRGNSHQPVSPALYEVSRTLPHVSLGATPPPSRGGVMPPEPSPQAVEVSARTNEAAGRKRIPRV
jgi:hypothetical protein